MGRKKANDAGAHWCAFGDKRTLVRTCGGDSVLWKYTGATRGTVRDQSGGQEGGGGADVLSSLTEQIERQRMRYDHVFDVSRFATCQKSGQHLPHIISPKRFEQRVLARRADRGDGEKRRVCVRETPRQL